jgi:hypothetical protein
MREAVTSVVEVVSLAAVVAGTWAVAGWGVAAIVGGAIGLGSSFLASR